MLHMIMAFRDGDRVEAVEVDSLSKQRSPTGRFYRKLREGEDEAGREAVTVYDPADFALYRYVRE